MMHRVSCVHMSYPMPQMACHMSHITCHLSHVTCHMPHVTCHMPHVTHMSHITYHMSHVVMSHAICTRHTSHHMHITCTSGVPSAAQLHASDTIKLSIPYTKLRWDATYMRLYAGDTRGRIQTYELVGDEHACK